MVRQWAARLDTTWHHGHVERVGAGKALRPLQERVLTLKLVFSFVITVLFWVKPFQKYQSRTNVVASIPDKCSFAVQDISFFYNDQDCSWTAIWLFQVASYKVIWGPSIGKVWGNKLDLTSTCYIWHIWFFFQDNANWIYLIISFSFFP